MNLYEYGLDFLEKNSPKYLITDPSTGIITATDSNTFIGVQTLFKSVKNKINFLCYDIGLSDDQKEWCAKEGLKTKVIKDPNCKHLDKWQTYIKPWFVADSPYEYTIWIDSDCIVTGNLAESDFIRNKQSFFIKHWIKQKYLNKNHKSLYTHHPVANKEAPGINAGVFGINKRANHTIIDKWMFILLEAFKNSHILDAIANWDEGALNWALQNDDNYKLIHNDERYNCFSSFLIDEDTHDFSVYEQSILSFAKSASSRLFFKHVLEKAKDKYILHFSTCMENKIKYWGAWDSSS
jgi:hypothetical protein